jgi:predicted nuclease of predicted toxin-antitoxin system
MKFLIDECLSTKLVDVANAFGYEAYHVAHRGWASEKDRQILDRIVSEEFTLVTNNRDDFLALVGALELHPGLVVIVDNVRRSEQIRLFALALGELSRVDSLINTVVEVSASGGVRFYELPAS